MKSIAIIGAQPRGLARALAHCGVAVVADDRPAAMIVACSSAIPPRTATTVLLADASERQEIAWLAQGYAAVLSPRTPSTLLAARLAALVRDPPVAMLIVGELRIDIEQRIVARGGRRLPLLPREYALLLHLARHAGRTVTRAALREAVWGLDFDPGTNSIEVHVSRLRAKLDRGFAQPMLLTDKGHGYRLSPAAAIAAAAAAG